MNKRLLVATTNPGKLAELKNFLSDLPIVIVSLTDLNIKDDVEEDGATYGENSAKKALFYAKKSGLPAISDDGGIEIAALNFGPGVHSRRWLSHQPGGASGPEGHDATDEELIEHMIKVSENLPENNRTAYFRTVVTLATASGSKFQAKGEVKGIIAKKPYLKLLKGYPYRSFFYLPQLGKYYHEAELSQSEQKLYNHRYKAVSELKPIIRKVLGIK